MGTRTLGQRLLRIAVVVLVVSPLILVAAVGGYMWWLHPGYDAVEFSRAAWTEADAETRGYMAESLLSTHELEGMTQQWLLELLGEPDQAVTVAEMYERNGGEFTEDELRNRFGNPVLDGFHHVTYGLGYRGYREGAPFVFPWSLHVLFREGTVVRTYIDD